MRLYRSFQDKYFPGQTFPGQDVSRTSRFPDQSHGFVPDKTFPGQDVSRKYISRTGRFSYKTFPAQSLSRTDISQTDVSRTSYTKEFSCT